MGASYYDSEINCALHTDLCSPLATDPTWSKLGSERSQFEASGNALWHQLIEELSPDIILISVARGHLERIAFADQSAWQTCHAVVRAKPGKRPYLVDIQRAMLTKRK